MHIESLLSARIGGHRHWVAAPVVALLLLLSLQGGPVPASVAPVPSGEYDFAVDGGRGVAAAGSVVLVDGGKADLLDGAVSVRCEGRCVLRSGGVTLVGWGGAFHAAKTSDALSVAGMTSPVLAVAGGQSTVVPAGRQARITVALPSVEDGPETWSSTRGTRGIPAAFLAKEMQALARIGDDAPASSRPGIPWHRSLTAALGLPAARDRLAAEESSRSRDELIAAMDAGDLEAVRTMLTLHPADAGVLALAAERERMLTIAYSSAELPVDLLLLAHVHPLFRDVAWVESDPAALAPDDRLLLALLLPASDLAPDPAAGFITDRWKDLVESELADAEEPAALLAAMLPVWEDAVVQMRDARFPERARRYSEAVLALAQPYANDLDDGSLSVVSSVAAEPLPDAGVLADLPVTDTPAPAAVESTASSVRWDPAPLEATVRARLTREGAMFLPSTAVVAESPASVRVTDVVFGTPSGDALFGFTLNPETDAVSGIERGDQDFPYTITFARFLAWVRGE